MPDLQVENYKTSLPVLKEDRVFPIHGKVGKVNSL